jgi:competence protein ComEA
VALTDRALLAGLAGALLLAIAAGWLLMSSLTAASGPSPDPFGSSGASSQPTAAASDGGSESELVVDVEGAVAEPGIVHLPPGSRVADALVAAGGYAPDADVAAASRALNLAAQLADGEQVYVPRLGDNPAASGRGTSRGLVNLNTASPEQLDALPGIGPVTVQKIVAARQERPFKTLDELVERKVLSSAQLSKIRDQATV